MTTADETKPTITDAPGIIKLIRSHRGNLFVTIAATELCVRVVQSDMIDLVNHVAKRDPDWVWQWIDDGDGDARIESATNY